MPKEAAPVGRSQARAHQQQMYQQGHQQPSSYHHLQQYHHLPRPPGYEYYSTTATYQSEAPQVAAAAIRDVPAAYEHALKMTAKYERLPYPAPPGAGSFKLATPYELHPPCTQAPQTSVQHNTSYDRTTHSTMAVYNRSAQPMGSAQYDLKMSAYPPALPYDRFSKKKLAAHAPDKSSNVGGAHGASRNDKKLPPTSIYDRVVPSTSYERLSTKVNVSSPMEIDKGAQNLSYERHKAYRASEYDRRERHRRVVESAERAEAQYERQYEVPVSSAYERLSTAPQPIHTVASSYERQPPISSTYERQTSVNAAYERRAVFDRAYEAAAYERRLFPPASAFSSLNHAYYTANYSRGHERSAPADEFEAKDVPTSSVYPAKPRMSLLTSPEYLSSLSRRSQHAEDNSRSGQASVIVPPSRSPADGSGQRKRLREGGKSEPLPPISIDTSTCSPKLDSEKPSIYMPTVEPISPTSPPDAAGDDGVDASGGAVSKSSAKDTLLLDISRVDREINKIEHHIFNLKRKQVDLEQKAKKSCETEPSDETVEAAPLPQHFSLSHKIYSENRRRAKEAHAAFSHLGPSVDLPLYNQPSDSPVYQENRRKHLLFKGRLIAHLRRKRREKCSSELKMTEDYAKRTDTWNRLVEKMESSPERKRRDAENRELFEKTFPKIRKEREDRERFLRVGSRVKSDADLEEIMDNLHEQEMEVKKMRDYAAVPPMLLSVECRRCVYVNTNGLIEDFPSDYKDRRLVNVWTDSEKAIFREKYLMYPKNFGAIAAFLERKSVSDCVQYYYLSKKTENYKRLLKKTGQKSKSGRSRNKTAPPLDPALLSTPPAPTIAPRFQRDYKRDGSAPPGPVGSGAGQVATGSGSGTGQVAAGSGSGTGQVAAGSGSNPAQVAAGSASTSGQPAAGSTSTAVPIGSTSTAVPIGSTSTTGPVGSEPTPAPAAEAPPPERAPSLSPAVAQPPPAPPPNEPASQPPAPGITPTPPAAPELPRAPDLMTPQGATFLAATPRGATVLTAAPKSAAIMAPHRSPIVAAPPTLIKPLILPFPDIPIVVIDDSDDSNSSSCFPYIKK